MSHWKQKKLNSAIFRFALAEFKICSEGVVELALKDVTLTTPSGGTSYTFSVVYALRRSSTTILDVMPFIRLNSYTQGEQKEKFYLVFSLISDPFSGISCSKRLSFFSGISTSNLLRHSACG